MQAVLKHSEDVIAQRVKSETILFHVASGEYYSLNDLAARIWELLDGSRSVGDVVGILASEYDAPAETIEKDAAVLLDGFLRDTLAIQAAG